MPDSRKGQIKVPAGAFRENTSISNQIAEMLVKITMLQENLNTGTRKHTWI